MCAGLAGFGGLDRFEGLEGLVSLEAFCFFDLLECVLLWLDLPGLLGSWEREVGLEGALDDGWDSDRDGGSEVAEVESWLSWDFSLKLCALAGLSLKRTVY